MALRGADLTELVAEPREALDIEVKEWLDLINNDHRALVAKELIALANHGGGHLVIGFEELPDGSFRPANPRPSTLDAWSQDAIQSIVAKYIDPAIQCRVVHQTASSNDRYPIVIVPGGHGIPVCAKSGSPDGKLVPHRVYVRRPGPASEEPQTAAEWGQLFERVLQNRKAELLEAYRSILAGEIPTAASQAPPRTTELIEFEQAAIARWEANIRNVPTNEAPRFPLGYQEVAIAIDGPFKVPSLSELRQTIEREGRNHSGWPPFVVLNRSPFTPRPIEWGG